MTDLSLYIHIPFCQRKCPYCDFNTYAGCEADYSRFIRALNQDILYEGHTRHHPRVPTLFLGGGTPTILKREQLDIIFEAVDHGFALLPHAEISSEANPGAVDQSRFETLRRLGVNRLSMGVQSFDEDELQFLGRIHSTGDAIRAMTLARKVGFENINLDLMFGMPQQTPAIFQHTLLRAIDLAPEHLSLYNLVVESGTPLATWVAKGQVSEPDPDLAADLYELACELLQQAGYHHYEISNWARGPLQYDGLPHYACHHNLVYWRNQSYLGLGPGAHSSVEPHRWSAVRPVGAYIKSVEEGVSARGYEERISKELAMAETMMLGLRLVEVGVDRQMFQKRFGLDAVDAYADELSSLQDRELVSIDAKRLRLTPRAKLLGNEVFAAFLPE
ncbi:MAG: radical SAM family heme chaperone HemW [Chloroflexi bacterium]|nr:radical SAM family heme chaperone HemW [Chloroflexota bacterium]